MKAEGPAPPETVETFCRSCADQTEQRVLKGKVVRGGLGVEGTFECGTCGAVHSGLVTFPEPVTVQMIVSSGEESYRGAVEVLADEVVSVGDEFEVGEDLVEVTAVELKDGRRVTNAAPADVATLWSKSISQVRVRFAVNVGPVTRSYEAWFGPDEEIAVGEPFDLGDEQTVVDRILTFEGRRYRGAYNVRDIKRVWLRSPKRGEIGRGAIRDGAEGDLEPETVAAPSLGTGTGPRPPREDHPPGTRPGRPPAGDRRPARDRGEAPRARPGGSGRPRTGQSSATRAPASPRSPHGKKPRAAGRPPSQSAGAQRAPAARGDRKPPARGAPPRPRGASGPTGDPSGAKRDAPPRARTSAGGTGASKPRARGAPPRGARPAAAKATKRSDGRPPPRKGPGKGSSRRRT